jgi:L-ascorbate metabolism protein UlaG (beta-lactamase superfamily)
MQFTYYGHSCFAITHLGITLLVDPFISPNELAADIDIDSIKCDYIFVSHGHEDHIADCVQIAKNNNAKVISNWEICMWLGKQGVATVHPMNTGGKKQFDFGLLRCVAAEHSSGLPDGSYGGNPMGFVLYADGGDVYYTGDTALCLDMQLIPILAKPKVVICPIGDNFTMGFQEAVLCCEFAQCNTAIGVHYNTFGYIMIDEQLATKTFADVGKTLLLPAIGSTIEL